MRIGIACASGSFKAAFVLGVLATFEEEKAFADIYAASSSAVIPASFAAFRGIGRFDGVGYIRMLTSPASAWIILPCPTGALGQPLTSG